MSIRPAHNLHSASKLIQKPKLQGLELYKKLKMQGCLPVIHAATPHLTCADVDDADMAKLLSAKTAMHLVQQLEKRPDVVIRPASVVTLEKELAESKRKLAETEAKLRERTALHMQPAHFEQFITKDASRDVLLRLEKLIKAVRSDKLEDHKAMYHHGQRVQALFTEGWLDAVYIKALPKRHKIQLASNGRTWHMGSQHLRPILAPAPPAPVAPMPVIVATV